ncbi:MAG: LuxR C-terminal-related transcriptional regulator [Candidatus Omnitrophica bacterium]|nr:LuxR C-terminal-related transcriptional regulator [Candidatus Omnitrophota bacterium]
MMMFKKAHNLKIVATIISIVFLCNTALYSYPVSKDSLRVPVGEPTYRRITEVVRTWEEHEERIDPNLESAHDEGRAHLINRTSPDPEIQEVVETAINPVHEFLRANGLGDTLDLFEGLEERAAVEIPGRDKGGRWYVVPVPGEELPPEHASDAGGIHIVAFPGEDLARAYAHGMAAYLGLSHSMAVAFEGAFAAWRDEKEAMTPALKIFFREAIQKRLENPNLLTELSKREEDGVYLRDYTLPAASLEGRRILVVDDNDTRSEMLRSVAKTIGAEDEKMTSVEDVSSAIKAIDAEDFDIVVLDMSFPEGVDYESSPFAGLQVIEHIVAMGLNIPILVTSGRVIDLRGLIKKVTEDKYPRLFAKKGTMADFIMVFDVAMFDIDDYRANLLKLAAVKDSIEQITGTVIASIVNMYGFVNSQMSPEKDFSASKMQEAIDRNPRFKEVLSAFIEAKLRLAHLGIFSREYQEAVEGLEYMRREIERRIETISSDAGEKALLSKALATADAILTSNLFDPFYDPKDPPALLFDGAKLTQNQYPGLQFVAYLPDRTGSFGVIPIIDFKREGAYTAGGFRIVLPGPLVDLDGKWKEVYDLAASMDDKSKWSNIPSAGSKLEAVLMGVKGKREEILMYDAPEILIRMVTAGLGLTGFGLFSYNIGGPDVNYEGAEQFQPIIDAIQLRCRQYVELEMKLIQAVLTRRIGGKEITPGEEIEIILEEGRVLRVSNDVLLRDHDAFWESPPEGAERGKYGIVELSGKGENFKDSREKFIRLYKLNDLALKEYSGILSILEEELRVLFPRDPNMYAMREQALQGIRDGAIDIAELTIPEKLRDIFNKILGVLIGGGAEEKGSLMAFDELSDMTARGVVRAVEHVHKYLKKRRTDDVGSVGETTVIVRGSGALGLPAAERLVKLGYKVTAISDKKGAVYKEAGFTENDIADLWRAQSESEFGKIDFVRAAFKGKTGVTIYNDPDEILWLEADILVPCAIGPTATQENAHRFNVKAIVAGENNMIADRKTEHMLHQRGILVFEGSTINFGTAYVVVRKEGELKYRLSPAEIIQKKQLIARECIDEVITSIDDLVPIMLALQDEDTTPGDIHRAVIREITSLMEEVYVDEHGVYAERIDKIIERIRDQGSYMPDHAARSYAAMEIARGEVILYYKQAVQTASAPASREEQVRRRTSPVDMCQFVLENYSASDVTFTLHAYIRDWEGKPENQGRKMPYTTAWRHKDKALKSGWIKLVSTEGKTHIYQLTPKGIRVALLDVNKLSLREREVLELAAQGLTNKEIVKRLSPSITERAVKKHMGSIYAKLGLTDTTFDKRQQAILIALENNVVDFLDWVRNTEVNLRDILSLKEQEVLELVAEAFTNKQIAVKLGISPKTVKNHINSIGDKIAVELGVKPKTFRERLDRKRRGEIESGRLKPDITRYYMALLWLFQGGRFSLIAQINAGTTTFTKVNAMPVFYDAIERILDRRPGLGLEAAVEEFCNTDLAPGRLTGYEVPVVVVDMTTATAELEALRNFLGDRAVILDIQALRERVVVEDADPEDVEAYEYFTKVLLNHPDYGILAGNEGGLHPGNTDLRIEDLRRHLDQV